MRLPRRTAANSYLQGHSSPGYTRAFWEDAYPKIERACDNPKFVEDVAQDVAVELNRDMRIRCYVIEAENCESIHNHPAFARIAQPAIRSCINEESEIALGTRKG